jgi:di/tricarboxylate transporter
MELLLVAIILLTLLSFAFEWMPIDQTALVCLGLLVVTRLISGVEAIAGFSNPAVITVMMMLILSESLTRSGIVSRFGHRLAALAGRSPLRSGALLLLFCGGVSAFINNTAAVSILIPLALQLAKQYRFSPSKILLPLSYMAILGGTCTLVGTSTNLLVSALAVSHGGEPFAMFDFLPLGMILLVVGGLYLLLVGHRILPSRAALSPLAHRYRLGGYLTELKVPATSKLVGTTVVSEQVSDRFMLNVLEILRGKRKIAVDLRNTTIRAEDVLLVRGTPEHLIQFRDHFHLLMLTDTKLAAGDLSDERNILAELQLAPTSELAQRSIREIDFRNRFGAFVLALNRTGETIRSKIASIPLKAWDTLLVFGPRSRIEALYLQDDFIPLEELDLAFRRPSSLRWWLQVLAIPAAVGLAALGVFSILEASILGVVTLLATGALKVQRAYKAVDWSIIFLIASMIPLGTAMENSGLAEHLANWTVDAGRSLGPYGIVCVVYLATALTTEVVTNNAAVILMVPVATTMAQQLGVDPKPLLMTVAYAGSSGFLTPMGYQTNAMVYGPGRYRFLDYVRLGLPIKLIFWILSTLMIPHLWPL